LYESSPGYVRYAPVDGLITVLLHILNIQVLKGNELVFIHQFMRLLMSKIVTPISLALVSVLQSMNNFMSFPTSLRQFIFLALKADDVFFVPFHPTMTFYLVAIAECSKCSQTQVNAYYLIRRRQRLWFNDTGEAGIPVTNPIPTDSQGFELALKRTMKLDIDVANLGKAYSSIFKKPPVAFFLRIRKTVIAVVGLEARVARVFAIFYAAKKGAKGKIKTLESFLHGLSMTIFQPRLFFFPSRKHVYHIVAGQTLLIFLPSITVRLESLVVNPTTAIKLYIQSSLLGRCREDSILECLAHIMIVSLFAIQYKSCIEKD